MAKLRWNCEARGCFNVKRRPKIEVFDDCFPGSIEFGDVDAIVEMGGRAILLEWKSEAAYIPRGQQIMYERLSAKGIFAMVVHGNAETMEVKAYCFFWAGRQSHWRPASLDDVRSRIRAWAAWASLSKVSA